MSHSSGSRAVGSRNKINAAAENLATSDHKALWAAVATVELGHRAAGHVSLPNGGGASRERIDFLSTDGADCAQTRHRGSNRPIAIQPSSNQTH